MNDLKHKDINLLFIKEHNTNKYHIIKYLRGLQYNV
jgi:hypothetical protein